MHTYKIRQATIDDAQYILDIYAPFITDTTVSFEIEVPALEQFKNRMSDIMKKYPYIVCETDGKVVGYAYASRFAERAAYRYTVDSSIYISPAYHRLGIGKMLYEDLLKQIAEMGYYTVFAVITVPNEKSENFHKAMGFEKVGHFNNVGYKFGRWLDVMWYEKSLRTYDDPVK